MTNEELTLLAIQGAIAQLSPEQQEQVKDLANKIRTLTAATGGIGDVAIALVGAELAAKD